MKIIFVSIFLFLMYDYTFAAIYKCKDSTGKVIYQEKACDLVTSQSNIKVWKEASEPTEESNKKTSGSIERAESTELVILQEATVVISQGSGSSFASLTLRPKWKNDNVNKVRIFYKTQFFDSSKTEIGVDNRFKDIDSKSVTTSAQIIGISNGTSHDEFDYKKISYAIISFRTSKDQTEKKFTNVVIKRILENSSQYAVSAYRSPTQTKPCASSSEIRDIEIEISKIANRDNQQLQTELHKKLIEAKSCGSCPTSSQIRDIEFEISKSANRDNQQLQALLREKLVEAKACR